MASILGTLGNLVNPFLTALNSANAAKTAQAQSVQAPTGATTATPPATGATATGIQKIANANTVIPGTSYTPAQLASLFGGTAQQYLDAYNTGGYQGAINISDTGFWYNSGVDERNAALSALNQARNDKISGSAAPITWTDTNGQQQQAQQYLLSYIGGGLTPGASSAPVGSASTAYYNPDYRYDPATGLGNVGSAYTNTANGAGNAGNAATGRIDGLMSEIDNYPGFSYGPAPVWNDQYGNVYNQALNEVLNRKEFEYSKETDPNYAAYAKQYLMEGDRATENAIARSAAMSGGIPSTASVAAGTQAGDYYAAQLSNKIPELFQQAYSRYVDEFNMDRNALGDVYNARNFDYGTYRDSVGDYQTDRQFGYNDYLNQYDMKQNSLQNYINADNTAYDRYRDTVADTRYDTEWANYIEQQGISNASAAEKAAFDNGLALLEAGFTTEEIANALGVPKAQVDEYAAYLKAVQAKSLATGSGSGTGGLDGLSGDSVYVEGHGPMDAALLEKYLKTGDVVKGTRNGQTYYYLGDGIVPKILNPNDPRIYASGQSGIAALKDPKIYGAAYIEAWDAVGRVASSGGSQSRAEEALSEYSSKLTRNEMAGILASFGYSYK